MTEQATAAAVMPPATSADGKRNAFYTDCLSLKVKKPYAMCQYIADHAKDVSIQAIYSDCLTEIRQCRCTAVDMRQKEQLEGRAIYFIERVRGEAIVAHQREAWVSPQSMKRSRTQRSAAPAPAAKPADILSQPAIGVDIHAAALNRMIERRAHSVVESEIATNDQALPTPSTASVAAVEPPATTKGALPKLVIRAGESPFEAIQRMKRERQNQQAHA
ncbi:hypothetical protein [Burkholderia contaminans]|uniref:Uncharacterized protein n=1 Tax=Burkholderia contaminans TaxID=488447 RepID=A0A3N8QQV7_9BURK|nr:hypothetical protein [Burkholderia contaminans]RQT26075.1 hypothetical protein DF037_20515 [Burkholderia contaminans]